jgi:hypothetical protein
VNIKKKFERRWELNNAKCGMKLKGIGGAIVYLFGCCVHIYPLHYITFKFNNLYHP